MASLVCRRGGAPTPARQRSQRLHPVIVDDRSRYSGQALRVVSNRPRRRTLQFATIRSRVRQWIAVWITAAATCTRSPGCTGLLEQLIEGAWLRAIEYRRCSCYAAATIVTRGAVYKRLR
jgi:hypothetical protein